MNEKFEDRVEKTAEMFLSDMLHFSEKWVQLGLLTMEEMIANAEAQVETLEQKVKALKRKSVRAEAKLIAVRRFVEQSK